MMWDHRCGRVTALTIVMTACAWMTNTQAEETRIRFDVPAAPAVTGIAEFSRQANINVLGSGSIVTGVRTNPVNGTFAMAEAIEILLAGTALTARTTPSGALFIVRRPVPGASAPPATPAPVSAPGDTMPTVTITGSRQAMVSGIEHKKSAATIGDAVVAEDIGQFPDKNIGEALSRITGVQIASDFGEGNHISIRGIQPDLNRVEINGMLVLSTAEGGSRAPELRELPSELIKSIDVVKGVTADITEGGIGGTVIIKTNRPFDFRQFTVASSLAAEHNSLRGGAQPRGNLLIADRLLDGRLGLMANVVYDKVWTQADRVRNSGWRFLRDWDLSPEKTVSSLNPAVAAVTDRGGCNALPAGQRGDCERQWFDYSPSLPRYGLWTRDHARSTGEFTAQYQLAANVVAFASYQRFRQRSRFVDRNFHTDFGSVARLASTGTLPVYGADGMGAGGSCTLPAAGATPVGMVVTNHHVTEYVIGDCVAVPGQGGQAVFSTQARDFTQRVDGHYRSGGLTWRRGAWDAEAMVSASDTGNLSESNFFSLTSNAPGLKVTLDAQGFPHFTFPAVAQPDDAASYTQAQLSYAPVEMRSSERQAKLDLRYRTTWPAVEKVWFGIQQRRYASERYADSGDVLDAGTDPASAADDLDVMAANVRYTWHYDPLNPGATLRAPTTQPFITANNRELWVSATQMRALVDAVRTRTPGFLSGAGLTGFPSQWVTPDYAAATAFFDTSMFNHDRLRQAQGRDGRVYQQIPIYRANERVRAAYVRADYALDVGSLVVNGNLGLRYAGTRSSVAGRQRLLQRIARSPETSAYDDRLVATSFVSRDNAYHDWLPSLNAAAWLVPDRLVLRAGYGKVMARPSLDRLTPDLVCTIGSGNPRFGGDGYDNCTGGNPELKPYRAWNKDVSLEWYPATDTQLSVAFFRKDIGTAIRNDAVVRKDLFGDGVLYDVTTTVNAHGASTRGVELAGRTALTFLPGLWRGLGVEASYTRMGYSYADGAALINQLDGSVLPFPGMSPHAYNISLWYDQGPLNARLAYIRRAGYYTGANDTNTGNPLFAEPTGALDAKLQIRLGKHVSLSLEAKNLGAARTLTTAGAITRPNEYSWSGRRYYLGMGYTF